MPRRGEALSRVYVGRGFLTPSFVDMLSGLNVNAPPTYAALRLGLDLVHVPRVVESLTQFGGRFVERVFLPEEIAYCEAAPAERARRFAARLAAKEAAWKALGLDDRGHSWHAIEVVRASSGACSITLHEPLRQRAAEAGVAPISLSITHEADYAAAVVLAGPAASPPRTA